MKRFTASALFLVIAMLALSSYANAQTKVGTVDVQRVRKDNPEFKAALKEIDDMVADFEGRRDRKQTELQQLATDMQTAQEQNVPASVDRLRNELQSKSQEFQTFLQETFGDDGIIETKSAELLEPVYAKLSDAAKAVAKAQSLDLILDLEQVNPLFVSDTLDVTDAVLTELGNLR